MSISLAFFLAVLYNMLVLFMNKMRERTMNVLAGQQHLIRIGGYYESDQRVSRDDRIEQKDSILGRCRSVYRKWYPRLSEREWCL